MRLLFWSVTVHSKVLSVANEMNVSESLFFDTS